MALFHIGKANLDLQIVGTGVQGGVLSPAIFGKDTEPWELSEAERKDLKAFQAAGWRFRPQAHLEWPKVQASSYGVKRKISPGLLARHSAGGLVILQDRVLLRFRPGISPEQMHERLAEYAGWRPLEFCDQLFEVQLRLPDHDLESAIRHGLEAPLERGEVAFAEPSILYHLPSSDPPLSSEDEAPQWQWDFIGLQNAWESGGSYGQGRRVAVIDRGFHRDEEIENVGWRITFTPDGEPLLNGRMPPDAHGTFCAGLIGARRDDGGVTGAAPDCELLLVALPPYGVVSQQVLAKAIALCADPARFLPDMSPEAGADVISCSLGPSTGDWELSATLQCAIDFAHRNGRPRNGRSLGTTVVWAVFNDDREIGANSLNAYEPLLSVSQCDRDGTRVSSGWGSGLDLLAPGDGVVGILWDRRRMIYSASGSSYAAPCVAGVAALVLAVNERLDWQQVADVLTKSCDPPDEPKEWDAKVGYGRLNAARAVQMAKALPPGRQDPMNPGRQKSRPPYSP